MKKKILKQLPIYVVPMLKAPLVQEFDNGDTNAEKEINMKESPQDSGDLIYQIFQLI